MKFRYLLPALVWSIIILWLLSIPGGRIPPTPLLNIPHFDKLAHTGIFAIFTLLVNYGLYMQKPRAYSNHHYTISLVLGVIFGIITELVQHYFVSGRSGEFLDVLADTAGCLMGMTMFYYWKRYIPAFLLK